ncbi:MAG: hypothetical protein P4M12_09825, partial [Gammaproteobacteria bacterium]|nr:hypothetical protein [Gammaproteobacteria bacterium]
WQDYMLFCQNREQLAQEYLKAADHLISMTDGKDKGTLICDKADFLASKGNMETAEAEYTHLFTSLPTFYLSRYRYALMLSNNGREDDAIKVLTDLLTMKNFDNPTHEAALTLLGILGGDTSDFEFLC